MYVPVLKKFAAALACLAFLSFSVFAQSSNQELRATAKVIDAESTIKDRIFGGALIDLRLSQPVPYRVFTLGEPSRVVVDFLGLEWNSLDAQAIEKSENILNIRFGVFQPGWTRMVLELKEPMRLQSSSLDVLTQSGQARLRLKLTPQDKTAFLADTGMPDDARWRPNKVEFDGTPKKRQNGDAPLVVFLDAGHGGVDPGAVVGNVVEKDLVLTFVKELEERLSRNGQFEVYVSRDGDQFVGLNERIISARRVGADVFLSFHADALAEGTASGITIYTLSNKASDQASAELTKAMDRAELLAGMDLSEQDDQIASVLMELARAETDQRSVELGQTLSEGVNAKLGLSRRRPVLSAGFAVLRAPDIPSILIELGFMTNPRDLANLQSETWRNRVQGGLESALLKWAIDDAVEADLLRQ